MQFNLRITNEWNNEKLNRNLEVSKQYISKMSNNKNFKNTWISYCF